MKQNFSDIFKELRKEKNLTQQELVNDFNKKYFYNYQKSAISMYENGRRIPEINALKDFADYFEVSVDYLLSKSSNPELAPVKTSHNKFKELRKLNNFSQEDIANKLNISTTAYGHYERGRTIPSTQTVIKLSKFYNVTTDYLLGLNDNPKLTQEEEKDVYKKFEELKDSLENTDDLMFCGEILDDETRELLLSSLKNTILTSKIIAKEREKNK